MKVHCAKCGRAITTYNRFSFTYAEKQYTYNDTQNVDKFILCHEDTEKLSDWLKASKKDMSLRFE